MLRKRLIASFFMIVPMVAFLWLDTQANFGFPGVWVNSIICLFSIVIASELLSMLRDHTAGATPWVVYLGVLLCHAAVVAPDALGLSSMPMVRLGSTGVAVFLAMACAFGHELYHFREGRQATTRLALTVFAVLYSGWLLSFLSSTRVMLDNYRGVAAVFSVLLIIKLSDAGAYFAGKQFGRHLLAPVLSPKKTIEGLIGGLLAALVGGGVFFALVMPRLGDTEHTWWSVAGYSLSLAVIGVFGDLSESLIKRDMGVKDSSGWLPGLGGIMDTADSVLPAAPVAFFWWSTGLL